MDNFLACICLHRTKSIRQCGMIAVIIFERSNAIKSAEYPEDFFTLKNLISNTSKKLQFLLKNI